MKPQIKKENIEILDLSSIDPLFDVRYSNGKDIRRLEETNIGIKELAQIKRINNFHYVIHALAFMIITPFLFMVFLGFGVPPEYSTIVSVVIGFYFGKSLPRDI